MKLPYFSHNFEMNHEAKVLVGISQMLGTGYNRFENEESSSSTIFKL